MKREGSEKENSGSGRLKQGDNERLKNNVNEKPKHNDNERPKISSQVVVL